ncbi:uncharacterized protein LOC129263551 [Lytechinus pictus]|uniref:uncharacterized protein LOC129263551 n=1 Tax=Lytechinus pictus TaxID=7653 RepID=UPI0030B9E7BF
MASGENQALLSTSLASLLTFFEDNLELIQRSMATVRVDWILLTILLVHCGDYFVNGIVTDVRLVGGPSPVKGTVQIMQDNGTWETTCGIHLDINDVIVICKQLGYTGANRAIFSTPYGQDPTPPTIGLFCNGREDDLAGCQLFQQQSCSITGAASCHGVNYLGCYVDKPGDRVFTGDSLLAEPLMTISYCIQYCNAITVINSSDYAYAGFNNGNECFCGGASDNYTRHGVASDRECQSPCQGDPTESCGGQGYIAVFRIDTETRETTHTIGIIKSTEKVLEMSTEMTVITDQPTSEMSINPNNDLTSSPTTTTLSSILPQSGSNSCIAVGIGEGVVIIILVVIVIALVLNNLRMRKMMKESNSDQKTQPLDVVRSSSSTDKDTGFYHDIQDVRESTSSPSSGGEVQYSSRIYEQKRDSALDPNDGIRLQHSYMM